jgi:transcriptional regulator with XRE-family HTH domain
MSAQGEQPDRPPIRLVGETGNTVTLLRVDFDALLEDLEDAEDRNAVLEHELAVAKGDATPSLTVEEVDRLLTGENPVRVWRQKIGMTQRQLAAHAGMSQSQLAEIETGAKAGSIDTLRKLAGALKVNLDALVPVANGPTDDAGKVRLGALAPSLPPTDRGRIRLRGVSGCELAQHWPTVRMACGWQCSLARAC